MKVLISNDGTHAHYFQRLAWANAFETHSKYGVKGEFHQMNKNNLKHIVAQPMVL